MGPDQQPIASGWRRDDEGRLVRETIHRMTRRLTGWNYREPAIYQITIVLADRRLQALGRLLMLSPIAWPYQVQEKPITRVDAITLNRVCQHIAGDAAAEINYHGMIPTNIDALAYAAAKAQRSACSVLKGY